MKILILWASLADYSISCFRQLSKIEGVEIFLAYHSVKSEAPFKGFDLSFCKDNFEILDKNYRGLKEKSLKFSPDIVLMSSWNFNEFMNISKEIKNNGVPIISAFDNQWKGSFRQSVAKLIAPFFLKPTITNFLVPGDRQAQFSYKLGYNEPIQGFYCANSLNFKSNKVNLTSKKFIFVGRFIEQKGIRQLIEAYIDYRASTNDPWSLVVVGEGPLKYLFNGVEGIELKPFAQPKDLPDVLSTASCFILPSVHENWGVVIHEAALAGLPIICSSSCGASTWFLRDGQNGFLINTSKKSIFNAFNKIHEKSLEELNLMSEISLTLGNMWTVDKWAKHIYTNFKAVIKNESN